MEQGRIAHNQFFALIMMFIISSSTLLVPKLLAIQAKQDAWVSALLSTIVSLLLVKLYLKLGEYYPGMTLTQMCRKALGKWGGGFTAGLMLIYFLLITTGLLRQLGDLVATLILPETPVEAVQLLFMVVVVMAVKSGLEVISRASAVFLPWILLFILFFIVSLLPQVQMENIKPFMERGIPPVLKGAWTNLGIPFLDLVIFLMIYPYVNDPAKRRRVFYTATLTGGIVIAIITLLAIVVLGVQLVEQSVYPVHKLGQRVNIGEFIQRIEAVIGGIWFISLFFKVSTCFYALLLGTQELLKLQSYKSLSIPFAGIIMALALLMAPSAVYFFQFIADIWPSAVVSFGLFIPLGLCVIGFFQKKSVLPIRK